MTTADRKFMTDTSMHRRNFIAGALGLAASPVFAHVQDRRAAFIKPEGTGDGSSLEAAGSLEQLGALVAEVGAGGVVYILADSGYYLQRDAVDIAAGGTHDAPVSIVGVDRTLAPRRARIRGNRRRWRKPRNEDRAVNAASFGGGGLFRFGPGSSFLIFSSLSLIDIGRAFDFSGLTERGITVEDVDFLNIRDGFYTDEDSALSAVTLRRFNGVGFSKKAVRIHGGCSGWLVEDCELDSGWQYGDNFAVGIELDDTANDVAITGGFTSNCLDKQGGDPDKYWNGDGVAAERGNYNIRITDHRSSGHTDGGYDLKSEDTVLVRCVAEDSKRNFRLWGGIGTEPIILKDCQSVSPRWRGGAGGSCHLWTPGIGAGGPAPSSVVMTGGSLQGGDPDGAGVFADGANAAVHLVDVDISQLGDEEQLFVTTEASSRLIVGSASQRGLSEIATSEELDAIAGVNRIVTLEADGEATWRLVESAKDAKFSLNGESLIFAAGEAGTTEPVIVQARGADGKALRKTLEFKVEENPVAPGTVLAVQFEGSEGTHAVDLTTLNRVDFHGDATVRDRSLHFAGGDDFVSVADSDNFYFDGPFTIRSEFSVDDPFRDAGQEVVSHWGDSSHQRGFLLRINPDASLEFAWSHDGREGTVASIQGPTIVADRYYKVGVDRDASGTLRLYLDGEMVARKDGVVEPIMNADVPLRISGRADGKYGSIGRMKSLFVNKGYALGGSDAGYDPEQEISPKPE